MKERETQLTRNTGFFFFFFFFFFQSLLKLGEFPLHDTASLSVIAKLNLFHATVIFLYSLKTSENLWFSDVFSWYRKRPVP